MLIISPSKDPVRLEKLSKVSVCYQVCGWALVQKCCWKRFR